MGDGVTRIFLMEQRVLTRIDAGVERGASGDRSCGCGLGIPLQTTTRREGTHVADEAGRASAQDGFRAVAERCPSGSREAGGSKS